LKLKTSEEKSNDLRENKNKNSDTFVLDTFNSLSSTLRTNQVPKKLLPPAEITTSNFMKKKNNLKRKLGCSCSKQKCMNYKCSCLKKNMFCMNCNCNDCKNSCYSKLNETSENKDHLQIRKKVIEIIAIMHKYIFTNRFIVQIIKIQEIKKKRIFSKCLQ